ncbi:VWA domain-containing protein [Granulicella arctica]|uniref:VWA domain-containing protein n=1 Tax=Granulicella arctica TaxID=940613 RepID=UPI0021E075C2|nr:VWA domain-containing protein [Granulicella arctica]
MVLKSILALGFTLFLATARGQVLAAFQTQNADNSPQPVTTLKVTSRMVAISAVVKGKDGEVAGGLSKDDFVLKQDGKEEPIRYFSQGSELPLTLALMVDTSGSQRTFIGDESLASDVFFETMLGRKEDRAMLVQFDASVSLLKGMTNSASALHLALSQLDANPAKMGGTLLNDAVFAVSQKVLAPETGRKAMVILSDGGDNGSRKTLADAIEQAQRADVQIYSILYSAWEGPGTPGSGIRGGSINAGDEALKKYSEATGGRVFTVSRTMSLRQIYAQIAQELRLQYELGYTPPPDTPPNSYHRLELKAKDKKLAVQARKGFFE